jgi:F-type H+-transporting ATPase subunit b
MWELTIFFLFLIILRRVTRKPLVTYFQQRGKKITDLLAAREQIRSEMIQLKCEHEVMKAKADEEIFEMRKIAQGYANATLSEGRERAKEEYDKIVEEARVYTKVLEKAAINELKSKTGGLVVKMAQQVIVNALSNVDS